MFYKETFENFVELCREIEICIELETITNMARWKNDKWPYRR